MNIWLMILLLMCSVAFSFDHFTKIDKNGLLTIAVNGGFNEVVVDSQVMSDLSQDENEFSADALQEIRNSVLSKGIELRYGVASNVVFALGYKQFYGSLIQELESGNFNNIGISANAIEVNFYNHFTGSDFLNSYFGMGFSILEGSFSYSEMSNHEGQLTVIDSYRIYGENYGWQIIAGIELSPIKSLAIYGEVRLREAVILAEDYSFIDLSGTYFEVGVRRDLW